MHAPPQSVYAELHVSPHAPLVHVVVALAKTGHAYAEPHPPQLLLSVCSLTHAPLQRV